jgi:nitric oxide reductase activation protein
VFAKQKSRLIREQTEANIRAYKDKEDRYLIAINRLAQRIRNTLLVHLEDESVRSRTGTLVPLRIWRATELNDPMVFNKLLKGDRGNITVDILIDSSFSQVKRRETVAAQGYMIAESLTRCGIPVRMYSFLSMSGYLVMDLYRDYQEQGKNDQVFRYYTAGANRDGLAVRMAAAFMKDNRAEHRILMILSDCKPNDAARVRPESGRFEDYASELGIEDTAVEVHRARMEGIDVLCIFTGDDAELPNARRIYGQDFARIRSLDQFADTVGSLLQSRIRNL